MSRLRLGGGAALFIAAAVMEPAAAMTKGQEEAILARTYLSLAEEYCDLKVARSSIFSFIDAQIYVTADPTFEARQELAQRMMDTDDAMRAEAEANVVGFCKLVFDGFGPEGVVIPGLLQRR